MSQTPLMSQYFKIKSDYPDTVILFRVGDFFETFDEDAKTASKALGITLTKRSNGKASSVPLAGFPHHAIDTYLPKLIRAGFRVAICEQVENPKFAKGLVKREVIELVTPGVVLSDKMLEHNKNNFLMAIYFGEKNVGISFADISTAEFYSYEVEYEKLADQFSLINPSEILISKGQKDEFEKFSKIKYDGIRITRIEDWFFDFDFANDLLKQHFNVKTLKGFGIEIQNAGLIASGIVLNYLKETQKANIPHIRKISSYNPSNFMSLDNSTKRNLEILSSMQNSQKEGSLINVLDKTKTAMGGRLLKKWITSPLTNLQTLLIRQNSISNLFEKSTLRRNLQEELKEIADLERLISRISTLRATPRELLSLKLSLRKIPLLKQLLDQVKDENLKQINLELDELQETTELIEKSISDFPALSIADGDVIRSGYNSKLDELRDISKNAKKWISNLQEKERQITEISSLKVSYNKVFGYYIEISNAHKNKIPENYIRKQTLVNAERYITPDLKEWEEKILNSHEKILELETEIFNQIRKSVAEQIEIIQNNGKLISELDCYLSLAEVAEEFNYVRPKLSENDEIIIKNGRHPVVEQILKEGEKFISNDCQLDNQKNQIIILTGPNMAGKSVYLRQIGLIVLLAQIGSFVPADFAEIGIVNRIYTRVGASDNISAGESTFLVEMQEAANILNNATNKSLILLDEIGRGTSTFDGISIAWSITEFLHENPKVSAKTLFATHYHELNEMAEIFPRIKNMRVEVREHGDKVVFLHKVSEGSADHSYGIQVAQMAGLPQIVTNRAKEILNNLESKELTPYEIKQKKMSKYQNNNDQYTLFEYRDDDLRKEISDLTIENLTPIQALNKLNELYTKAKENT